MSARWLLDWHSLRCDRRDALPISAATEPTESGASAGRAVGTAPVVLVGCTGVTAGAGTRRDKSHSRRVHARWRTVQTRQLSAAAIVLILPPLPLVGPVLEFLTALVLVTVLVGLIAAGPMPAPHPTSVPPASASASGWRQGTAPTWPGLRSDDATLSSAPTAAPYDDDPTTWTRLPARRHLEGDRMTDTDTWTVTCNYCGTSFDTARPRPFCSVHCRDRAAWYGPTVPAHRNYAARRAVHADRRASTNPTHTTPEGDAA